MEEGRGERKGVMDILVEAAFSFCMLYHTRPYSRVILRPPSKVSLETAISKDLEASRTFKEQAKMALEGMYVCWRAGNEHHGMN